jgi:serine protease Do
MQPVRSLAIRFAALCGALLAALPAPAARADRSSRRTPIVAAVERVAPATVNITSTQQVRQANPFFGDPFFDQFFERFRDPRPRIAQNLGTGVIIDEHGHVLTNEHVLAGATETRVTLSDGREFPCEVIGSDPDNDLGVLRIKADGALPMAPLGDSDDVMIGETVIAIGNPFGLNHTITTGVLSATQRSIQAPGHGREYHGFLQTDASINPGNSGGPLVNVDGEVIGVNTAILGNAEGIGFAIPINRARRIVQELIEHGTVSPTWLGLGVQDLTPALLRSLGAHTTTGALVSHVFDDSPASRADVRRGDIVVELDRTPVRSRRGYFEVLGGLTSGGRARLVVERDGERRSIDIDVDAFPEERAEAIGKVLLGIEVSEARWNGAYPALRIDAVTPNSAADDLGLQPGDFLLALEGEPLTDRVAFRKAITKLRGRSRVGAIVARGPSRYRLTLELP